MSEAIARHCALMGGGRSGFLHYCRENISLLTMILSPLPNVARKIHGSQYIWISLSRPYVDTSSRWRLSEFKIEKVPHHFVYPMFAMVFFPKCRRQSNAEWTSIRRIPYLHGFPFPLIYGSRHRHWMTTTGWPEHIVLFHFMYPMFIRVVPP